jgi:hypothetical protein
MTMNAHHWSAGALIVALALIAVLLGDGAKFSDSPLSPAQLELPQPLPPEITPPLLPQSPAEPSTDVAGSIGSAEMDARYAIHLHVRPAESRAPEATTNLAPPEIRWSTHENIGYGEIVIERSDVHYDDVLHHLGGLVPGQVKSLPSWGPDEQWHCALDPDRGPCPGLHLLPGSLAL